jgi:hypothetical protein
MLGSLTNFNTYVDGRSGAVADKAAIKGVGATLARAAVREAVEHTKEHLDAALLDNPSDTEMAGRVAMMQRYLDSVEASDG